MKQNSNQTTERWGIRYTGIVQGVGFRPLVSMLAPLTLGNAWKS